MKTVLQLFRAAGGTLFDTAPVYGNAESISGSLAQELGIHEDLFLATKISTAGGRRAGQLQGERSMRLWARSRIDPHQMHNLQDLRYHLPALHKAKRDRRIRYVGATVSQYWQYEQMETAMREETLDFVQLNYSLGERGAADRLIPLAAERGIAVIVNRPFMRGDLFRMVRGRDLSDWAAACDCQSWAQVFLKYVLAHPGVTAVIPATADPEHLLDNMGAGGGALPDERMRQEMRDYFDRSQA